MKLEDVSIQLSSGIGSGALKPDCVKLLQTLGLKSGDKMIEVSSVTRSAADQARIMYDNCKNLGVRSQMELYSRAGDKVIMVYLDGKNNGLSRSQTVEAMRKKIIQLGPSNVSKHCADPSIFGVLDIPFSSIKNHANFKRALEAFVPYPISRFLDERNNSCFHVEMRLTDVQSFFRTKEYEKIVRELGMELV
jgi:hypothetical protein